MRIQLEQAFILHTRNYTDSRFILDCITYNHGRIQGIARGGKSGAQKQLFQPFVPLMMSWQGRGGLKTLTQIENHKSRYTLTGNSLFAGFYLNELLTRLVPVGDTYSQLFQYYEQALQTLSQASLMEESLRKFELQLLSELGYGICFTHDGDTGSPIEEQSHYLFDSQAGFLPYPVEAQRDADVPEDWIFSGSSIKAIGQWVFSHAEVKRSAKRLCRLALKAHLGEKPLKSRELFGVMS